jgi:hypothetical protein
LLSRGPDLLDTYRRAASYVDRILRGAKPGDLPVQFPTKFEVIVNLKRSATAVWPGRSATCSERAPTGERWLSRSGLGPRAPPGRSTPDVARSEPSREATAASFLGRSGFATYLPRIRETRRNHGRRQVITPALFPNYLFVRIELQSHTARWTVSVAGLIMSGDVVIDGVRARERGGFGQATKSKSRRPCNRRHGAAHLKAMTDGELHAYFYNLDDSIKPCDEPGCDDRPAVEASG